MNDNKPQMVPGFNHNVKHMDKVYHVQTEDSGVANPHIITHLFVGGNILATKKTSYADIVQANNLHEVVKELMQEQHKAMLRNLINGVYDEVLEGGRPGATPPAGVALAPVFRAPSEEQPSTVQIPQVLTEPKPRESTASTGDFSRARTQPSMPAVVEQKFPAATETPPLAAMGVTPKPLAKEVPKVEPPVPRPPPAPTPRESVSTGEFTEGRRLITKTRIYVPEQPQTEVVPLMRRATARVTVRPKAGQPAIMPPEVLAAQNLSNKPKPKDTSGPTIFGEDLITEKSLDEVIIGYLSGDGEDGG